MVNNSKSRSIVFFGTEDFSAHSLQALIDNKFNITAIITKPDTKRGRGQKLQSPTVKKIGEKFNIPVFQPQKMSEISDFVNNLRVRPIGVLVSFGRIIPQSVIDLFDGGIINLHPSILPKYRGPSPIESAILNGDKQTGVSIMLLTAEMDAGPVFEQKIFDLNQKETSRELYDICAKIGSQALVEALPAILEGSLAPIPQNNKEATYCKLLSKDTSLLIPEKQSAIEAERQVRAYEIFPRTKIKINEHTVIIKEAETVKSNIENSPLIIKFNDGNYLKINKIIAPSGKQMDAKNFINGYLTTQQS